MTKQIEISNFFGYYPDIHDPLFNTYISRKEEFAELVPGKETFDYPKRGDAFNHQKSGVRFMTYYDRCLFEHEPGTGKSCIITHLSKLLKEEYYKNVDDPTKIKKFKILVKGPTLQANIQNEIICKCTDSFYEDKLMKEVGSGKVTQKKIRKILEDWIEIITFGDFSKEIDIENRNKTLDDYMSNVVICADEAHNIPTIKDIRKGEKNVKPEDRINSGNYTPLDKFEEEEIIDESKEPNETGESTSQYVLKLDSSNIYDMIFLAFHSGTRNKIFLFTATPEENSPLDFIPLINLILPMDQLMPRLNFSKSSEKQFIDYGIEYFEPYLRGRISYLRNSDSGATPKPQGVKIKNTNTYVYRCYMSEFQYSIYLSPKGNTSTSQGKDDKTERFYSRLRSISNFVFPDGSYGGAGFNKYIEKKGERFKFRDSEDGKICKQQIQTNLKTLSTKYAEIIRICNEAYPGDTEAYVSDDKGVIFIYFADYVVGSGAIMLGLCLEEHGYEAFTGGTGFFKSSQDKNSSYCTENIGDDSDIKITIPKRKRYAILTGRTPPAKIPAIFNVLNSKKNVYGEYIQILIGSQTAKEGINIKHGAGLIKVSGSWHPSADFQANYRIFRAVSHQDRIEKKKEYFLKTGRTFTEKDLRFDVKTYNMVAVYKGNPNSTNPKLVNKDFKVIDTQLYAASGDKDFMNAKLRRYRKMCAYDCFINYERNVRPTDINGSSQCDYTDCNYECTGIDKSKLELDRSTKILYYSENEINAVVKLIKNLFSKFYSVRINKIKTLLSDSDPIYVELALEKMITQNVKILDRFGFPCFLRESSTGLIYLEKEQFETLSLPENSIYNFTLNGINNPFNDSFSDFIINKSYLEEQDKLEELIKTIPPDSVDFDVRISQLSLLNRVELLEEALYQRVKNDVTNDFWNGVINSMNQYIFEMIEPLEALKKASDNILNKGKHRGNKSKSNKVDIARKHTFNPDADLPGTRKMVYIHIILAWKNVEQGGYAELAKYLKAISENLRILNPNELNFHWRNLDDAEKTVYGNAITKAITRKQEEFDKKFQIYGIILPLGGKFMLKDKHLENTQSGAKGELKGKGCNFWNKALLIDILWRLDLPSDEYLEEVPPDVTREDLIKRLPVAEISTYFNIKEFEDEKLLHFYRWYKSGYISQQLCDILKNFFLETDRIFDGRISSRIEIFPEKEASSVGISLDKWYKPTPLGEGLRLPGTG